MAEATNERPGVSTTGVDGGRDGRAEQSAATETELTATCSSAQRDVDDLATAITSASQRRDPEAEVLASGTLVGRYMVLDKIAAGGMGSVYRAYDPKLDRRVAIKVVSVAGGTGAPPTSASARLVREAKALARALWQTKTDRPRALALAAQAGKVFSADERPSAAKRAQQVARWLDKRGVPFSAASPSSR